MAIKREEKNKPKAPGKFFKDDMVEVTFTKAAKFAKVGSKQKVHSMQAEKLFEAGKIEAYK